MDFIRIGEKLISSTKLQRSIEKILQLRSEGVSQLDIARDMGLDRSFISRLESLAEVRKGGRIALIGFPVSNPDELRQVAHEEGCDFTLLLTDRERWEWVDTTTGIELLNKVLQLIARLKDFDSLIIIGSDLRIRLVEAIIGKEVFPVSLGESPIREDRHVNPQMVRDIIRQLKD